MIYDIIIIGAGASGLAAAISAKQTDRKLNIAALDAMPKVGKKILATGNGRCNLSNLNAAADSYTNPDFVSAALNEFPPERVIEFFRSIGLLCVADGEGRVYPMSNTASSVLDALRSKASLYATVMLKKSKRKTAFSPSESLLLKRLSFARAAVPLRRRVPTAAAMVCSNRSVIT